MTPRLADAQLEQHGGFVWRVAYHFLRDEQDASDVAQEVLLRLHREPDAPAPEGLAAWLYRVTANVALNFRRDRARLRRRHDEAAALAPRIVEAAETAGLADDIARAIRALPKQQRAVVTLKLMEELTFREIAGIFGVAEGTVKVQFSRGMRRLRDRLAEWR